MIKNKISNIVNKVNNIGKIFTLLDNTKKIITGVKVFVKSIGAFSSYFKAISNNTHNEILKYEFTESIHNIDQVLKEYKDQMQEKTFDKLNFALNVYTKFTNSMIKTKLQQYHIVNTLEFRTSKILENKIKNNYIIKSDHNIPYTGR